MSCAASGPRFSTFALHLIVTGDEATKSSRIEQEPGTGLPRLNRTGTKKTEASVGLLAQALGDLPLAMEQAAACIERTRMDFTGYLKRFETHWAELLSDVRTSGDYPDSVEMTWEISFRQLQEENATGAELLNLLAFLGPDSIPRHLLRTGAATLPEQIAPVVMNE